MASAMLNNNRSKNMLLLQYLNHLLFPFPIRNQ